MRLSTISVVGLLFLTGCASGRVATNDAASLARQPAPKAPHALQGPVAVLGVPSVQYPPLGACRVWMPGVPPGEQQAPCPCFSLLSNVPPGAWVLYRPSTDETVLQVTTYDAKQPNKVASVDFYDARTGEYLQSGQTLAELRVSGKRGFRPME